MPEKIERFFNENKAICLIILLFSFQLSPITSMLFPNSPTLAYILQNIFQIGILILAGVQWLGELSPKLLEDLDSMELDKAVLFKHNVAVVLSALFGAMIFISPFLPVDKFIDNRVLAFIFSVLLAILLKLKCKYAQGKQSKDTTVITLLIVMIIIFGLLIFI